jgi:hypothetical protein
MPFWCYSSYVYGFDMLLFDLKFKIKKGDGAPLKFSIGCPAPQEEKKRRENRYMQPPTSATAYFSYSPTSA